MQTEVHVSPSSSDKPKKHNEKATRKAKGKSPVDLSIGVRDLRDEFEEYSVNITNWVNVASAPSTTVIPNLSNSTNSFNVASSSNNVVSLNFKISGKSLFVDPSQYPDDPDMPASKDIVYSNDEEDVGVKADFFNLETNISISPIPTTRVHKDHHISQITGELTTAPQSRSMAMMVKEQGGLNQINDKDSHTCIFACFLSQEEPKRVHQALKDPSWIGSMQEELLLFKMQKEEGIDYEEVFAPVARIEAIRLFLAYALWYIEWMSKVVFFTKPLKRKYMFVNLQDLKTLIILIRFTKWSKNFMSCIKLLELGMRPWPTISYRMELCKAFEKLMKDNFQMSSMGELTFFLGLQIKKKDDGIFISQDKYVAEILRKFGLSDGKSASTPIDTEKHLLKDPDGEDVDVHIYRGITKLDVDADVTLVDIDTVIEMDANTPGRMEEDVSAVKELNVAEPTVFDDKQVRPIFEREYNKVKTFLKPDRDEKLAKKRGAKETLLQESFRKLRAKVQALDGDDDDDDYDKEISTNTDIFEIPSSDAITTSPLVLPIEDPEDSLIMGNEELNTILEKKSDEFIKSSVEDLVPILRVFDTNINHTLKPTLHFNSICYYDDDDDEEKTIPLRDIISQLPPSIVITTSPFVLPIEDLEGSLIMGNKDLNIIHEKESDEVIKSSVEALIPIPSESEDVFGSDNDDDESLSDEDVLEDNVKIYSNPLFEFDDEYISSDVNPLFDKVLEDIESKASYDSNLDEPSLLVTPLFDANEDECFDPRGDVDKINAFNIPLDFEDGYYDSKGDVLYLKSFLSDDTTPNLLPEVFLDHDPRSLSDINDLKIMVKVFDPGIPEKFFLQHMLTFPLRIAIIFFSHILSEFFFLSLPIQWILLFFSPPGVRILFLTPASLVFIFLL
uniref:Reverse transcriptase Ty1/copia-type domain-containing protein n=1 Tax=Tanacetum cinerariifolium TaxID=118510 RepID=A0A6L2NUT8_TANCI|nr:hypothetical protein [Tanacetum cinerariifolium]